MQRPMRRLAPKTWERRRIDYDVETTRIEAGTPTPLYLSVCDDTGARGWQTIGWTAFHETILSELLTEANKGCRFVGYNSNRYDAFLIANALKDDTDFIVEPWLTKAGALRGMRIRSTVHKRWSWTFSDAMAMTGFVGKLSDYTKAFAPEYSKSKIDILNFDPYDVDHQRYAINDAKILHEANTNAFAALRKVSGIPEQNTIGKLGIGYFQANMPEGVLVWRVPHSAESALDSVVRGGYVYCDHRYLGNIWKYDVNQAYAAAMRERLPSGRCARTWEYLPDRLGMYLCTIERSWTNVPFYIQNDDTKTSVYTHGERVKGWILSNEYRYLTESGWTVEIHDGWSWTDSFTMEEMVNHLEHERTHCDGGPKGPLGLMVKAVGNNAYGKTQEVHDGKRLVFAAEQPSPNHHAYRAEDANFDHVWFTTEPYEPERYHQKQIGAFITAYVRIKLMNTALLNESAFLYADTDCIAFSEDMTNHLDIDSARYGAYKVEANNERYGLIAKKTYWKDTEDTSPERIGYPLEARCKGLDPRKITLFEWHRWYKTGEPPTQDQVQRYNVVRTMETGDMFRDLTRKGSRAMPLAGD
jgi:hypothetical protein